MPLAAPSPTKKYRSPRIPVHTPALSDKQAGDPLAALACFSDALPSFRYEKGNLKENSDLFLADRVILNNMP